MKRCMWILVGILIVGITLQSYAVSALEYQRAMEYLESRNEVYFKLFPESITDLMWIAEIISIDNVTNGCEVFAYANTKEFLEFAKHGIDIEVLTPPGLQHTVRMAKDMEEARQITSYPTYPQYVQMMEEFESEYPELCDVEQFGTSVKRRKMLYARITSDKVEKGKKPKFFYQSTIHGDETSGWIDMLNLIKLLCSEYGSDPRITRLVDSVDIFINPLCNPDGTYRSGDNTVNGAQRYNANGVDLNRDFPYAPNKGRRYERGQKETNATVQLGDDFTFVMSADYHSGAELCCYVWGSVSKNHPDKTWWEYVGNEYARNAQRSANNNGYFTDQGDGCLNAYQWYKVDGERINYAMYEQECRDMTVEVQHTKLCPESQLQKYWNYQKESLLAYMEQVLNGIRGVVTDSITGEGLEGVKVFVSGHDKDNSHVFTHDYGYYFRPIQEGTHTVEFTLDGYEPEEYTVHVYNDKATILNVKLWDGTTHISEKQNISSVPFSIVPFNTGVRINFKKNVSDIAHMSIFDVNGKLIRKMSIQGKYGIWNGTGIAGNTVGNGCYIVKLQHGNRAFSKEFILAR